MGSCRCCGTSLVQRPKGPTRIYCSVRCRNKVHGRRRTLHEARPFLVREVEQWRAKVAQAGRRPDRWAADRLARAEADLAKADAELARLEGRSDSPAVHVVPVG